MKAAFSLIASALACAACLAKPPSVMLVYPAGGCAGTSFKAVIGALDADSATGISISGAGVSGKILKIGPLPPERAAAAARRDEAKGMKFIEAEISIDPGAEPGIRDLRLESPEGASSRYFFRVGNIPEIREVKDHQSPGAAQNIGRLPAVINGQIYEGERDFYRFELSAGKTYVFDLAARAIRPYLADAVPGWFQAVMRLSDASGETAAYCDDWQNSPDPVIIFTPKKSGAYVLEIRDALFRGRDDFVYRLSAGELPFIEAAFPCGGGAQGETEVSLIGANLPSKTVKVSKSPGDGEMAEIRVRSGRLISNPVKFMFDSLPEENISPSEKPPENPSPVPRIFNGVIRNPYDAHWVRFAAKKGEELVFEVFSARLGYPADARLRLYNAKTGAKIAENDDVDDPSFGLVTAQFDPRIIYRFREDGEYLLKLDDSRNQGGDDRVFRLKIAPPKKSVELTVTPANPQIPLGNFAPLTVRAVKRGGWDGKIEIAVKDLPKGFSAEKCAIEPGKDSSFLMIKSPDSSDVKSFIPSFSAKTKIGDADVELPVRASEELTQAFFIIHTLPVENISAAVLPKAPFRLEWGSDLPELPASVNAGNVLEINMRLVRDKGFNGPVRIGSYRGLRGLQVLPQTVKAGEEEFAVRVRGNPNAVGVILDTMFVTASFSKGGKTYMHTAPPLPYRVFGKSDLKLTK